MFLLKHDDNNDVSDDRRRVILEMVNARILARHEEIMDHYGVSRDFFSGHELPTRWAQYMDMGQLGPASMALEELDLERARQQAFRRPSEPPKLPAPERRSQAASRAYDGPMRGNY